MAPGDPTPGCRRVVKVLTEPHRTRGIVVEVLREALVRRGLEAIRIISAPGPESRLLEEWAAHGGIRVEIMDTGTFTAGAGEDAGPDGDPMAAGAAARTYGVPSAPFLDVHAANKLQLILDPPPAHCAPLGDVWWSQIRSWTGDATLPGCMRSLSASDAEELENALRVGLEGGMGLKPILERLQPGVRTLVESAYRRSGGWGRPILVPKLTEWTWGLDPHF